MGWVDSDAHVVETPHTWDYLEPADRKFRPTPVQPEGATRQYWMIEGKIRGLFKPVLTAPEFAELSRSKGRRMDTPQETREMENVEARLRHMDQLGIETQVLYPTIFLDQCADRPEVDVALCGAYNRWLADLCKQANGRLRWMCVPPFLSIPDALDQIRFAKENGACGIFMRAIEGYHRPVDSYFYPIYEEASRLDLCIGLHQANGNQGIVDFFNAPDGSRDFFNQYRMFNVGAFYSIVAADLPSQFPKLRVGFIETAASWVPWVLMELRGRIDSVTEKLPVNMLQEYRLYITCQNGDDVPYLVDLLGEDNLLIGTDYGHADSSTEIDALQTLSDTGRLSAQAAEKIVNHNGRAFYGL